MSRHLIAILAAVCSIVSGLFMAGCDSTLPSDTDPSLVVEGFIDTGRPVPSIRLSRTTSLKGPYDALAAAVTKADITVTIGDRTITYAADLQQPGVFRPADEEDAVAEPGERFTIDIDWNGERASAGGIVPPQMRLLSADVTVPDEPVSAVLLDSLLLSDSLAVGAYEGFIFPIEVSLTWEAAADAAGSEFWVRAQLRPYATFSSTVVDLFLRSESIFREDEASADGKGTRTWTGVYAVGVDAVDDPVPDHALRIAVIRSGRDYARFAASRHAPERREPASNLKGAVGIFTAISVDSIRVQIGAAR